MKKRINVSISLLLCMYMVATNMVGAERLYGCSHGKVSSVQKDADSVKDDSLYNATFLRFFDEVIDVDEVKNVLSEKFRKDMRAETRRQINDGIIKTIKENDVVSPMTTEPEKYEQEIISLSEATDHQILQSFFGNDFFTVCCESYVPYFNQSGLTVEDMEYIISCYEDSSTEKALNEYRKVAQKAPFIASAQKYIETCYRSYNNKGYLPTEKNECPELRPDYDRMFKATSSDKILDVLMKKLVPDFEGRDKFETECREAVICHCMQRYKDAPMCLKVLPDLVGSSAYANYIKGLGLCNKNILTSVQQIQERFTLFKDSKISELVNLCVNEYCDNYLMLHKSNPFSKPELRLALDVSTPGTLCDLLTAEQKNDVTHLKLSGMINAADFKILRAMMGSSAEGKKYNIQGALQHLDLSAVTFAESEDAYQDRPLTGIMRHSKSYQNNFGTYHSSTDYFDLAKMTQKDWRKFHSVAFNNMLKGDDFKLEFDGSQVHKKFLLKPGIIGKELFANCVYLKVLELPNNTNKVNEYAFSGCNNIQQIVLSENVKKLENRAFSKMKSLQSVSTPRESIIVIERHDDSYSSDEATFRKKKSGLASLFEGCPECKGLISTIADVEHVTINYRYKM